MTPPESPKSNSSRSEMRVKFDEEKPKEIPRSPVSEKGEEGGGTAEVKDEGPRKMSRWKSWKQRKKLQGAGKEKGAESNPPKGGDQVKKQENEKLKDVKKRSPTRFGSRE